MTAPSKMVATLPDGTRVRLVFRRDKYQSPNYKGNKQKITTSTMALVLHWPLDRDDLSSGEILYHGIAHHHANDFYSKEDGRQWALMDLQKNMPQDDFFEVYKAYMCRGGV